MWFGIIIAVIAVICISVFAFINQPSFGRLPQGERLERIKRSPHYRDGQFSNLHQTPVMASDKGFFEAIFSFLVPQAGRIASGRCSSDHENGLA